MKILAFALILASVPAVASGQETMDRGTYDTQLRDLQHRAEQLGSEVNRSRTALALIGMQVFDEQGAARVAVVQENRMGPLYRLVSATYAIDGTVVHQVADPSGSLDDEQQIDIYRGAITPGEHLLTLRLEYVGDGGSVVRYLEGYRFVVRSSHRFTASDGRGTRIRVIAYEREAMRTYAERPWVGYVESLDD